MRRRTRFGLIALIVVLVLAGAYSAAWLFFARQVEAGFVGWAEAERADKVEISWKSIGVGGFPLALRVELDDARLVDRTLDPALQLRAPSLSAAATPWNFRDWRILAGHGATGRLAGAGARPPAEIALASATGTLAIGRQGGQTLWLRVQDGSLAAGERIAARRADAWIIVPATPPRADSDPLAAAAFDLVDVELPASIRRFGDAIDEVSFGLTMKGPFSGGPLRQAVAAWRDAGGTLDLDRFRLQWGALEASASGTLALDRDLQPQAAFSGAVEGFDQLIGALVRSGLMPAKSAGLARLALMVLAKAGPDGRPRISTSFTIQNGEMRLGPAHLGKAPRIDWN